MPEVTFRGVINVADGLVVSGDLIMTPSPAGIHRSYDPFESETGLFLMFSQLFLGPAKEPVVVHDREKLIKFSSQYGLVSESILVWQNRSAEMWGRVRKWKQGTGVPFNIEGAPFSIRCPETPDGHSIEMITDDLWTCLQLQFNLAVINGWKFRECTQCGKPFAIIPPATRSNRVYCSNACSAAAYRKRQELKSQGTDHVTPERRTKKQSQKTGTGRGRSKKDK